MKFLFFFLPILLFAGANTGSVMLYNDSPFILTATVQASDGSFLGQVSIQPGQQRNFTQNLSYTQYENPGAPDISLTPYTVTWQCASEEFYSMCTFIGPGALVRANDCPGNRVCKPKPEQKKEAPASTLKKTK
ncbi:MAG: hypothetical protein KGJ02_01390 [Verrucomicrobiota bacterium]|nr:hypothetical protein [Verrucomicrobiota bacterium]